MKSIRTTIGGLGNLMFKEAYITAQMLDSKIPDLYVQSPKYWGAHAETIKARFSDGIGEKIDKVSIHIRRGDYLNNQFYIDLWPTGYYQKAIAIFPEDTQFLVFCRDTQNWEQDKADRQWCRDNLAPILADRFELPPKENTEWEDMNLMASCKSNILANSSFSFWAGFLNPNPDKIVIAPSVKNWYSDGVERTECPQEWMRV